MTWEEFESMFPTCSAAFDVLAQDFDGDWRIETMFVNALNSLTIVVMFDRRQRHNGARSATFTWGPGPYWWWS